MSEKEKLKPVTNLSITVQCTHPLRKKQNRGKRIYLSSLMTVGLFTTSPINLRKSTGGRKGAALRSSCFHTYSTLRECSSSSVETHEAQIYGTLIKCYEIFAQEDILTAVTGVRVR